MTWLGFRAAASKVVFNFTTEVNGLPTTLSGTPALSVYKDSTTESTSGITLTVDYDSRTGMNHVVIDTSADGTFYAAGNDFSVVITTGTLGGVSQVGVVVGHFSIPGSSGSVEAAVNVGQIDSNSTAATNLHHSAQAIARGTVTTGATTTSVPTSAFTPAGAAANQFAGRTILFDADTATAALQGQAASITASTNAATPTLTVSALTTAPASGDTFSVL